VTESEDVFVARMHSGDTTRSRSAKTSFLTASSSNTGRDAVRVPHGVGGNAPFEILGEGVVHLVGRVFVGHAHAARGLGFKEHVALAILDALDHVG
jgi:hypothetical protein